MLVDRIKTSDRRTALRITPEEGAPIRIDLNGADFIDIFYAVDISTGGLALQVPHHFEGCKIDLLVDCLVKLPPPISHSFHAQGKITHISGTRFGVAFQNLNEHSKNLIRDYVEHRLKSISRLAWITHQLGFISFSSRFL